MTSSGIPYRFEKADGYAVISLQPELNNAQWADIEKIGTDLLNQLNSIRSRAMIVDLSALNYMGSAMVALIVRLWKSIKEDNGRMVVVNRDPNVFEVLKLAGLHKVWTVVETREQSVKALGKRPPADSAGSNRTLLIVGIIALLAVVAGAAYWLGRMGGNSSAPAPAPAPVIEQPAEDAQAPAEAAEKPADEAPKPGDAIRAKIRAKNKEKKTSALDRGTWSQGAAQRSFANIQRAPREARQYNV